MDYSGSLNGCEVELKWKLKVESVGVTIFSVFYAVVGCLLLVNVALSNLDAPPHVGVLGFLSLITAYGLIKMRKWSVVLVIALFFVGETFGATTLYYLVLRETFYLNLEMLLFHLALIAYLIMMAVATIYVMAKRRSFGEG